MNKARKLHRRYHQLLWQLDENEISAVKILARTPVSLQHCLRGFHTTSHMTAFGSIAKEGIEKLQVSRVLTIWLSLLGSFGQELV